MDRAFRRAKPGSFEARPKGVGLIALRPFAEGEYLGEYCGELYPPWRWFEKEASASAVRKAVRRDDEVPTFYDAVVERRREDPRGYDAMFVDGHVKGSVLTRASHSCEPNAAMRVRVREGSYALEMIAVKPVAIGEEICWDYKCSTDSREEMRRATCCCGARGCRVSYLYYTADDRVNAHAAKHGTAARFTAALLRACGPVADGRDEAEESRRLERTLPRGVGIQAEADGGARAGAPQWLARVAADCAAVGGGETEALERSLLKEALAEREEALRAKSEERGEEAKPPGGSNGSPPGPVPGPSDAELAKMRAEVKAEAANVAGGRAQSLATTIDKVRRCLAVDAGGGAQTPDRAAAERAPPPVRAATDGGGGAPRRGAGSRRRRVRGARGAKTRRVRGPSRPSVRRGREGTKPLKERRFFFRRGVSLAALAGGLCDSPRARRRPGILTTPKTTRRRRARATRLRTFATRATSRRSCAS